ncbi:alpha/beta hydrolase [Bradyrhizobium sp. Gha]|uniref:alpha/beta hydrolase n=1 Tax=Bradyrhizobium sp. Gha TaxID=1855318 RepID=UPI0008E84307|nr:alpha/beta hydrolase [Bradyrhizobium sp. Gha]SFI94591.1 Acetyl esterase/lipase [Bradyrhizobium sp. Gha]
MADEELATIRQMLSEAPPPQSLDDLRRLVDLDAERYPLVGFKVEKVDAGGVAGEWAAAEGADKSKVVLYLHGGGYGFGSILSHRHLAAEIGKSSGCRSLIVDYRLAPENPFPAAIEDAGRAYQYLLDVGVDPRNIAVAGDSAGGGLAVATMLSLKNAGKPLPACAWLISPWVDLEAKGLSFDTQAAVDPMVKREMILQLAGSYLNGSDPKEDLASPIHADLRGLPPMLIQVGAAEVLLDDAVGLARRAGTCDVEVQLEIWPEMIHIWHTFFPVLAAGRRAIARGAEFVYRSMCDTVSHDGVRK